MTIQECYDAMGGNYAAVLHRMANSERMVKRFAKKFLDDPSYTLLHTSLDSENYEEAFRAAHTLKGVCQNLNLDQLFTSCNVLCDTLRNQAGPVPAEMLAAVDADYAQTVAAIKQLDD